MFLCFPLSLSTEAGPLAGRPHNVTIANPYHYIPTYNLSLTALSMNVKLYACKLNVCYDDVSFCGDVRWYTATVTYQHFVTHPRVFRDTSLR